MNKTRAILDENGLTSRASSLALAIWFFREIDLGRQPTFSDLVLRFVDEFSLSSEDQNVLFSPKTDEEIWREVDSFGNDPMVPSKLLRLVEQPPDAKSGKGRSLESLRILSSGLADELKIGFGERLSLITGDNGLGKSFILEFAWKAATGVWAGKPLLPELLDRKKNPKFQYWIQKSGSQELKGELTFDYNKFDWVQSRSRNEPALPTVEALCVFSRADGSFAVFDPVRNQVLGSMAMPALTLTGHEVWNGKEGTIEGLIRDWKSWETSNDRITFDRFRSVLKRLSPEDLGELRPGPSLRIPGDPREIPTIRHQYGEVPIIHASSGVQRVLLLSYLIIWAWQEHELASRQLSTDPLRRLVVFVDELEAHLHPKWQRIVLPALMRVGELLSGKLSIQTIAATHSPMILASIEPSFSQESDVLYHLHTKRGQVNLDELPFVKYGDATGWLTSPLFGLRHARSRDAERTIERAKELQLQEDPDSGEVSRITDELRRTLSNEDAFWPRWIFFAESHGVEF